MCSRASQLDQSSHIAGFDYLRIAAIFSVVWIHGSDTNTFAKNLQSVTAFAVPCFVLLTAYLTQSSAFRHPERFFPALLYHRFKRLLPAYLVWSGVYMLARGFKHFYLLKTPFEVDWPMVVFGGGASYQLWFIPALILWTLLFGPVIIRMATINAKVITSLVLMLMGLGLIYVLGSLVEMIDVADENSLIVKSTLGHLGYFPFAMGLALLAGWYRDTGVYKLRFSPGWILLLITLILLTFFGRQLFSFSYIPLYSILIFVLGFAINRKMSSSVMTKVSAYAYGIYLCHGLFVEGLQLFFSKVGLQLATFPVTLMVILAAFILSAILCTILARFKATRWLVA